MSSLEKIVKRHKDFLTCLTLPELRLCTLCHHRCYQTKVLFSEVQSYIHSTLGNNDATKRYLLKE